MASTNIPATTAATIFLVFLLYTVIPPLFYRKVVTLYAYLNRLNVNYNCFFVF